jgi:5-methyltetrahydrofolate--homocysteine methyltransferase
MDDLLDELKNAVVEGDADRAAGLAQACLAAGIPAATIFETGIVGGIREAGVLWDCDRYRVPDVILSADAFNLALAVIEQQLRPGGDDVRPKIVLGVVEGDVHDLGKNILAAILRGAGLHVVDLGVDVSAASFVDAVRHEEPAILGIGAYMSTTMLAIPEILAALEHAGLRSRLKVLIGGVPTTQPFADSVGVDGWAPDASAALRKVKELLGRGE